MKSRIVAFGLLLSVAGCDEVPSGSEVLPGPISNDILLTQLTYAGGECSLSLEVGTVQPDQRLTMTEQGNTFTQSDVDESGTCEWVELGVGSCFLTTSYTEPQESSLGPWQIMTDYIYEFEADGSGWRTTVQRCEGEPCRVLEETLQHCEYVDTFLVSWE